MDITTTMHFVSCSVDGRRIVTRPDDDIVSDRNEEFLKGDFLAVVSSGPWMGILVETMYLKQYI